MSQLLPLGTSPPASEWLGLSLASTPDRSILVLRGSSDDSSNL